MENFNDYLENFKKLDEMQKKRIIYKQLCILNQVTNSMCEIIGAPNNQLIDIEEPQKIINSSNDEYLTQLVILTNSIQNSIANFNFSLAEQNEIYKNGNLR